MKAALDSLALVIGWMVILATALRIVSELWWQAGELVYKHLIPLRWREAQVTPVPGANPLISRRGLAVMYVLGGPRKWLSIPRTVFSVQREKRRRLAPTESEGGE